MSYDLPFLISCLCCVSKYSHIYEAMKGLSVEEIKTLRYELRKAHGRNLNSWLEMEFKNKIGE